MQRLALRPAADPSPARPRIEQTIRFADDVDRWTIDAGEVRIEPVLGQTGPDAPRELVVLSRARGASIELRRSGSYDLSTIHRVRLVGTSMQHCSVAATFLRDGREVAATAPTALGRAHGGDTTVLTLPASSRDAGRADELVLRLDGNPKGLRFAAIDFLQVPMAALLGDVAPDGRLVQAAGEWRRGFAVASGPGLEADVRVPAEATLSFSYAWPAVAQRPGGRPRLALQLSGDAETTETFEYPLSAEGEAPDAWRRVDVPLAGKAGERLRVRFEVLGDVETACAVAEASVWSAASAASPSVLLVTSDTHRGDHVGAARLDVDVATPTLDGLAARGVFFEDCFSPTNLTNPSHIALMTGTHPRDVGILKNNQPLAPIAPTLAERFAAAGWRTWAAVSARHLGHAVSGLGQGFDRVEWTEKAYRPATATIDVVERWLDEADERPVFLWVHLFDAHHPYRPPRDWDRRYYDRSADPFDPSLPDLGLDDELPSDMRGLRDLEYPRAQYRALVSYLDDELARLVERPPFADGAVAFVSDHGESLGNHGVYFSHAQLYPDSLHIPLILTWPGAPAGTRSRAPVSHVDVGRTLLDVSGLAASEFPGESLATRPTFATGPPTPRFALGANASSAAVTFDGMHLILHLRSARERFPPHSVELYDLRTDPGCHRNLVDERTELARELRRRLIEWLDAAPSLGWGERSVEDPELLEQLRQLGYTGGDGAAATLWQEDRCAWCLRMS